jgi:hypothetical protein
MFEQVLVAQALLPVLFETWPSHKLKKPVDFGHAHSSNLLARIEERGKTVKERHE